jgi:MATE family multidrug resistance protein
METFCGQAYGAQRYKMVGLVLQRGLVISFVYCCGALWSWQFNGTLLVWMGQVGSLQLVEMQVATC